MLLELFDATGAFNAARFVLLSKWGAGVIALVALMAALVVGLAWHNVRPLDPQRRRILVALRAAAVLLLFALFLQPGVRLENVSRMRNHVAVLVDDSRSMTLPGRDGTRLESARELLDRHAPTFERWRDAHHVDLFAFSDHARPIGNAAEARGNGDTTRIVTALEDVAARFRPEDLAAVVVVSDGADNGLLGEIPETGELPGAVLDAVGRLRDKTHPVPVHTVFTGPDSPPRDIAIARVAYDEFAFVRNVVSIEADVQVNGFDGIALPVTLRRGDTVLGTRMLQTRAGQTDYRFEFEFVPDKTGKSVFTLEVGFGPGEQIRVNNRRDFAIRIIRDKIRALQVVGRPSWDQRFLRKLLKKNPNVDLISFFILRTGTNLMLTPRDEMSLIPFPTQELFEVQLGSFDLIIFQNFTYRGYHMRQYLPLIRDYVANGGGFVMVGGDLSFASGGYSGTPIAEFLPVELPRDQSQLIYDDRFKPRLTDAGRRHPITALSLVPEDNETLWGALPELSGTNRLLAARAGATVLLEHPQRTVAGDPMPVAASWGFGEGRVLTVATDSTWHWDFLASGDGGDNRHYYKFWGNAIRWLIRDPALQAVRVEADRDRYPLGTEVTAVTRVFDRDYSPAVGVPVRVEIERVWYDAAGTRNQERVLTREAETTELGEVIVQARPEADGAYRITARAALPGGEAEAEDVFVVATDPIELRETRARRGTLEALADAGQGRMLEIDGDLDGLARLEPQVVKVNRRRDVAVWASAWWLLLCILLPSAEWFLRRRWGLI